MSDDQSPWQQPGTPPPSGAAQPHQWSPPAVGHPAPAVSGLADSPPPSPPRSNKGKVIGALVGVGALVAAGAFAITQMSGDDDDGGAGSAREVGTELIASLEEEDVLGVVDLLLPGERDTFRQPLIDLVDELSRIEVLDDSATLDDIGGVDLKFTDVEVDEEPTNVDDITNFVISGTEETTVNGEEVPLGQLIIDRVFDGDRPPLDVEPETDDFDDLRLTAVERDGRWYLSALYSIAESARRDGDSPDIPEEGVAPAGADDPEGAVDGVLQSLVSLDLESVIAGLNPNEAEALQRYAPLFLDDVSDLHDELGDATIALTDTEYSVDGTGSSRYVNLTGFTFTAAAEGQQLTATLADGCLTADIPDQEPFDSCDVDSIDEVLDQMGDVPPELEDAVRKLADVLGSAFDDYDATGLKVDQVDGKWYLSPIGTSSDLVLSVLRALDRGEIDDIIDAVQQLTATAGETGFGTGLDPIAVFDPRVLEGGLGGLSDRISQTTTDAEAGDAGDVDGDDAGDDVDVKALTECYARATPAEGVACIQTGIAAGTIDPLLVGAAIAHPECGVAEIYFDNSYTKLDDASFVAMASGAAPCFQQLVASGATDEYQVPIELLSPDCLEGRNYNAYSFDRAYNDRLYACASA